MAPPPAPQLQDVIRQVEADAADPEPLGRLRAASALVHELVEVGDVALGFFVDQARLAGHSWSEIGEALGVSKQAAQQKHTVRVALGFQAPTFERFTPRARNVVAAAEPTARRCRHAYIGTEHLLLALYTEPDGIAAQVLVEAGLGKDQAEVAVAERAKPGPGTPEDKLAFTPMASAVFSGALAAALELHHNYIGTEHLLLGLSRGDGLAAEVLAGAGLTRDRLGALVGEKLAGYWVPSAKEDSGKKGAEMPGVAKRTPKKRSAPARRRNG